MNPEIIIIGAGGHGRVVAELILAGKTYRLAGFADDALPPNTKLDDHMMVITDLAGIRSLKCGFFIVAIGDNLIRSRIYHETMVYRKPALLVHPFTCISPAAMIGMGTVVLPGAVIAHGARIGENCIIGSQAHIDHDTVIGNHAYIRNGSSIGSNCVLPDFSNTETGAALPAFTRTEK